MIQFITSFDCFIFVGPGRAPRSTNAPKNWLKRPKFESFHLLKIAASPIFKAMVFGGLEDGDKLGAQRKDG